MTRQWRIYDWWPLFILALYINKLQHRFFSLYFLVHVCAISHFERSNVLSKLISLMKFWSTFGCCDLMFKKIEMHRLFANIIAIPLQAERFHITGKKFNFYTRFDSKVSCWLKKIYVADFVSFGNSIFAFIVCL